MLKRCVYALTNPLHAVVHAVVVVVSHGGFTRATQASVSSSSQSTLSHPPLTLADAEKGRKTGLKVVKWAPKECVAAAVRGVCPFCGVGHKSLYRCVQLKLGTFRIGLHPLGSDCRQCAFVLCVCFRRFQDRVSMPKKLSKKAAKARAARLKEEKAAAEMAGGDAAAAGTGAQRVLQLLSLSPSFSPLLFPPRSPVV